MKYILALLLTSLCGPALADNNPSVPVSSQAIAPQLVLAMDRILPGATEAKIKALLPDEARAVLNLYLTGQVSQWYFRQDRPGVVFLLKADSVESAQAMVDALPLSKAGLLAYDLIPVGPYIPLATLLNPAPASKPSKKKAN
ncbi:MAG: hypothetical protein ACRERR_15500 [Moraxellaceae bacterium]